MTDTLSSNSFFLDFLEQNYGISSSSHTIPILVGNDLARCLEGMGFSINQDEEATLALLLSVTHMTGEYADTFEVAENLCRSEDTLSHIYDVIDSMYVSTDEDYSSPLVFAPLLSSYNNQLAYDYVSLLYDVAYAASMADGECTATAMHWLAETLKPMRSEDENIFQQLWGLSLSHIFDEDYFIICKQLAKDTIAFANLLGDDKVLRNFLSEHESERELVGVTTQDYKQRLAIFLGSEIRKCYNVATINYHLQSRKSSLIYLYSIMLSGDFNEGFNNFNLLICNENFRDVCIDAIDALPDDWPNNSFHSLYIFKYYSTEYLDTWNRLLKMIVRVISLDDSYTIQIVNSIIDSESDRTDLLKQLGIEK